MLEFSFSEIVSIQIINRLIDHSYKVVITNMSILVRTSNTVLIF